MTKFFKTLQIFVFFYFIYNKVIKHSFASSLYFGFQLSLFNDRLLKFIKFTIQNYKIWFGACIIIFDISFYSLVDIKVVFRLKNRITWSKPYQYLK